ncbi:MAG: hypothetical protein HY912_24955 [Desulfomonile tiedjei]|uniref:DUF8180 domain-containing protein n=1 Tax=Desulfomonile tiedjei TaxID=2358 RepID=A0A9D6V879_9BACT|nr:hypothetical protein [Desulfomonile tiedjei]
MDDLEKSKVRLSHWIGHNLEHLKGYLEVAGLLETLGRSDIADRIRLGVGFVEQANQEFEQALSMLGGSVQPSGGMHNHSHSHEHSHGDEQHDHEHEHSHGHCGLHRHEHEHD